MLLVQLLLVEELLISTIYLWSQPKCCGVKISSYLMFGTIIIFFSDWMWRRSHICSSGLNDLGWTSSSWVFSATDNCLHLAERGSYLSTCCVQSSYTTRLARTSYKIEQIISNVEGAVFSEGCTAYISFPHFSCWNCLLKAHFQLPWTFSTFVITTRRTNPAFKLNFTWKGFNIQCSKMFPSLGVDYLCLDSALQFCHW